jgi:hypothetical protein
MTDAVHTEEMPFEVEPTQMSTVLGDENTPISEPGEDIKLSK